MCKWPHQLRTLVQLVLSADQPMFIAWGNARILLYNDAYAQILSARHPDAMGRPFLDVWPEIRAELAPIVAQAFAGQSLNVDDIAVTLHRRGYPEEAHFSFSYTPVRGDDGKVQGLFCACSEITGRIAAQRRMETEATRLRRMFERAPGFICLLRGPTHVVEFVNLQHRKLFESDGWVGKTAREAIPEVAEQGFHDLLDTVFATGERYVGTGEPVRYRPSPDAPEREVIHDFIYEPMRDDCGTVIGIFCEGFDVTETHLAREALRRHAERQDFRLALEERLREQRAPGAIMAAAAEVLGRHLDAGQIAYAEIDLPGAHAIIERDWNDGTMRSNVGVHHLDSFGPAFIADLKRGLTIVIDDVREDIRTNLPEATQTFARAGIRAFLNVPLIKDGALVAVLAVHNGVARPWTADEVSLVEEVAERTWAAVERARAELDRDRAERHRVLLINELNHRVKNTLAIVQAIAAQTFKEAGVPRETLDAFGSRIGALATAHKLLTRSNWTNTPLDALIRQITSVTTKDKARIRMHGPSVSLEPKQAVTLSMALHELATNALKYGALCGDAGHVEISWSVSGDAPPQLDLIWRETGGPPVQPPRKKGFGTRMIKLALAQEFDGEVLVDFRPDGMVCQLKGSLRPLAEGQR